MRRTVWLILTSLSLVAGGAPAWAAEVQAPGTPDTPPDALLEADESPESPALDDTFAGPVTPSGRLASLRPWAAPVGDLPSLSIRPSADAVVDGDAGLRLQSVVVQRWFGNADTAVGIGVGALALNQSGRSDLQAGGTPVYSVSVQHRLSERTHVSFDLWSNQRLSGTGGSEVLATRWNLEWRPTPSSGFGFSRGGVHFRFDASSVMSLRVRGGGAKLYYRVQF